MAEAVARRCSVKKVFLKTLLCSATLQYTILNFREGVVVIAGVDGLNLPKSKGVFFRPNPNKN